MTAQNDRQENKKNKGSLREAQSAGYQRGRFPEPKAWALNWETLPPEHKSGRANGRFNLEKETKSGNARWNKFPQPRGWALQWDGHSIDAQHTTVEGAPWTPEDEPSEDET